MTSLLRKKPRTTPARRTRRPTGISLALAVTVALAAGRAAPAQLPSGTLPPVAVPTPQLPPPAGLPAPAPRPQLVPADAPSVPGTMPFLAGPTPPAPLPVLAPAPTMTLSKPAGAETTRPLIAQPVSRTTGGTQPVPYYSGRPQTAPVVVPVAAQPPADPKTPDPRSLDKPSLEDKVGGPGSNAKDEGKLAPIITLDPNVPPIPRDDAFRFQNDAELDKRIVGELVAAEKRNPKFEYKASVFALPQPAKVGASGVAYVPKTAGYGPTVALIEPGYLVHRRLLFEEKNAERNGWDLGFIQPLVSTAAFYKDALLMPAHLASNLAERYDTSAGKCLPGNAVPYYLYPEEVTLFGATVGAVVVTGAAFVFP